MCSKQKSLNFGNYVPNDKLLNKRVPENPKYKHVKPAIDTGKNVRTHIDELKEKQKNCIYKKDEIFKRIKVSAFIKLALACAAELASSEDDNVSHPNNVNVPETTQRSPRRCVANVLMGIGELDVVNKSKKIYTSPVKPVKLMPYLLLDVRDRDAFSRCHIITAKHYPSTMLSRSIGYEIEDLKLYKNCTGAIIILYDDDEITAARVATTLVERGYENIYLLSGGLKLVLEICPHGITTSSPMLTPVHMLTHGATYISQKNTGKEYLTQEDVAIIQNYIDIYPYKDNNRNLSVSSSRSKTTRSGHKSCLESTPATSRTSTTSRTSCNSSSIIHQRLQQPPSFKNSRSVQIHSNSTKSTEQMHFKPSIHERTKSLKRAPWK